MILSDLCGHKGVRTKGKSTARIRHQRRMLESVGGKTKGHGQGKERTRNCVPSALPKEPEQPGPKPRPGEPPKIWGGAAIRR